ncbi:alpha/beta hydrolase [Caballeronia udeis]|uniref:Alpha/beta hydrolase n=1 Tax=Caballeronia udeis TaxID=1232866 RepID=A0A158FDJ8_9BURK|nr:alpha/beta hydrolase [Caballeronia udeis]SAL17771.1 alpha/beta hydrolase [Caballeronia udeis]
MTEGRTNSGIHYEAAGSGEALVCISGLGGLASFWRPVAALLADRYQVICFDHPGVGRSVSDADQRIPAIAQAALDVLDAESVIHAHFIGHSTGSLVVQTLALDHPGRCGKLVLSGGWVKPDRRFRDLFDLRRRMLEKLGTRAYSAFSRLGGYDAQWYEKNVASSPLQFDGDDEFDKQTVINRIEMLLGYDRADELAVIDKETLVMGARDDFIVPFHHSEDLAQRIRNATLVEAQGGHFFPQVDPQAFALRIGTFLDR